MKNLQLQFYQLLRHHANWWNKAYYFAAKQSMCNAVIGFLVHAEAYNCLADYILNLSRAQFARWLFLHQREYVYLIFHLKSLYPDLPKAA